MSFFLDIDRSRSVFRLLFHCSLDSYGNESEHAGFDATLFHVTDGVQIPTQALEKLQSLYCELAEESCSLNALASEVVRDFESEHEILSSILRIVLRLSNDEGMLCAKDRSRVRIVAQRFRLCSRYYEHFSDFERGMLASCLRDVEPKTEPEDLNSHFQTLGCSPEMSAEEVRRRYRELVKEVHPDRSRVRGEPAIESPVNCERFQEIHHAYQSLREAFS